MGRRKKKTLSDWPYDNRADDEEWDDKPTKQITPAEQPAVSLRDFMVPDKVSAFVQSYEPCDEFDAGAERFDDARLREYFKAYVCPIGDPLSLYIEDLKLADFRMVTSLATNIPCIFARRKF